MDRDNQEKPLRRVTSGDAIFLLAAGFIATGCELIGYRPLVPSQSAHLESSSDGVYAHIETLHAEYRTKNPTYRVDVRIENRLSHEVRVAPEKVELAQPSPVNQANQSLKASSGAGAVPPKLPLVVVAAIDASTIEGDKNLDQGESGTYRIVLPNIPIDDGRPYALVLDGALGLPRGTLQSLPLVRPGQAHLGYLAPTEARWIFAGRLGGGAIRRGPYLGGLGGFEIFIGRQIGRFAFGGFGTLGAGAWGGEMRMRFEPAKRMSIVPFFGYGYYPIVGYLGFNAGHGPRWGFELQFSTGNVVRFGYARNSTKVGLYALGGPVFLNAIDGVGTMGQVGLSFGIF